VDVKDIRLEQVTRFYMKGSALQRTMTGGCLGLETRIHVESDEPPERIRDLIRMGEQTCFTLGALTEQVPTTLHATLNGQVLE
jgi:hypothetical protein